MKKLLVLLAIIGIFGGMPVYAATKTKTCKDSECFLEATKNCQSAKITVSDKSSGSGITITQTLTDEISGTAKNCSLKMKYDKYLITFDDKALLKTLPAVSSTRKIDTKAFLTAAKADLKEKSNFQGKGAICKLDTATISEILASNKSFFLMAAALDPFSCKGTLVDFYKNITSKHYLELKDNNRISDLQKLQNALEAYRAKFNAYPVQNITFEPKFGLLYCLDDSGFSTKNCIGQSNFLNSAFSDKIVYSGTSNTFRATVKLDGKITGIRSFIIDTKDLSGTIQLTPSGISKVLK